MKQALALLGAVLMIGGALWVRDSGDDDTSPVDGGTPPVSDDGERRCAADLADACRAAGLDQVAVSGAVADALLDPDADLGDDLWITTAAWVALVADERSRLGLPPALGEPVAVAESTVVMTIWADAATELDAACGRSVDWSCLAETFGASLGAGGRVSVAVPSIDTATGLVVAADMGAGLLGRTDYASNDFTPDFRGAISTLTAGTQAEPVRVMRSRGPGAYTAAGVVVADADAGRSSNFGTLVERPSATPAVARVVVVAGRDRKPPADVVDDLRRELLATGWSPPSNAPTNLPGGGVLAALRTLVATG